jgi:hypothetical protein
LDAHVTTLLAGDGIMEKQNPQNQQKQQAGKPAQPNPMSGKPAQPAQQSGSQQGSGHPPQTGTNKR